MIFKGYTKRDTAILKGFAILCIVFHNYFHWLEPSSGENEFTFSPLRVTRFFELFGEQPGEFLNILLSFLGHYGVQVFIFVSGFGLALSMARRQESWGVFVLNRLKKLYPLLITGVVVVFLGTVAMTGRSFTPQEWKEIGYKMLFIHNLLPESGLSINGPWWFFALIFQLYLLFPLLYRLVQCWEWKGFALVSLVSYAVIFVYREVFTLYHGYILMQTAMGHLPEFCLGILLAFSRERPLRWWWLLLALSVFGLGNVFSWCYPFTFLAVAVITVFAYQGLKSLRFKKRWLSEPLAYFGGISMLLFAVHGSFRSPFLKLAGLWVTPLGHLATGLLFFGFVWLLALGARPLYEWLSDLFSRIPVREFRGGVWLQRSAQLLLLLFFLYVGTYYIRQDMANGDSTPLVPNTLVQNGQSVPNDQYITLARFGLQRNYLALHVKGSFDYRRLDGQTTPPMLVLDIRDRLWKIPSLSQRTEGEWIHYEFNYDYLRPFVSMISGREFKVYVWNRDQSEVQFRNFAIFASY